MQRSKDMRCSHKALFNHLVGELLQIERHLEAKHLGGREMMTRSNFVARWTGRSPGRSPLRMRAA
jgi:hypothetical protein